MCMRVWWNDVQTLNGGSVSVCIRLEILWVWDVGEVRYLGLLMCFRGYD